MKKFLQNIVARALCVLVLGGLLIAFSEKITTWIVMMCGLVFIVPGAVALVSHFRRDPESRRIMLYPIIGAGSILFGLVLLIWPTWFIEAMMYILSVLLLLVAATQLYTLWDIGRGGIKLHPAYYVVPALELAGGLYVLLSGRAVEAAALPVILLGCGFVIYALLELWTVWLLRQENKKVKALLTADKD